MIKDQGGSIQTDQPLTLSGAAARREYARREMRQAILDEARRILGEEGAAALSIRAIARALDYSPAALYEYFPSKEAIFVALYFDGTEGLGGHMSASLNAGKTAESATDALIDLGRAYRGFAHEHPELFRLVFSINRDTSLKDHEDGRRPGFDELLAVLERGIAAGEFVALDVTALGVSCWSIVHGFVMLEIAGFLEKDASCSVVTTEQSPERDALFELVLRQIVHGIARR